MPQKGGILESTAGIIQQSMLLRLLPAIDFLLEPGRLLKGSTQKIGLTASIALPAGHGPVHLALFAGHRLQVAVYLPLLQSVQTLNVCCSSLYNVHTCTTRTCTAEQYILIVQIG